MVKWLSKINSDKGKSLVPSTIITLIIVAMLILSGPAQAVAVNITGIEDSYTKGEDITFQVTIDINDPDKYVPVTNISIDLTGPVNKTIVFALDGTPISGGCNIKVEPVSTPVADYGYGSGYGYENRTGYGYNFGYGYGYGYGYGSGGGKISFVYNVTISTSSTCIKAGDYSVTATLNTGKDVVFESEPADFEIEQGDRFFADVEIKPETLNLASKGIFTAFITSTDFDIGEINGSTVKVAACEGCKNASAVKWNKADKKFIAKFRTQDLGSIDTGEVRFIVSGELRNGTKFEGSDIIKVINKGKNKKEVEECDECDDHIKEHDHDDECEEEHDDDHEDECEDEEKEHKKVKEHKSEKKSKNQQKNVNTGKGKNNVVNNINIIDNSGTVIVNINNGGSVGSQGGSGNGRSQGNSKGKK